MEAYGVPKDDPVGLLPWAWAEERLLANRNYWVATVDPQQRPHVMPVWGVWQVESESFWFGCSPESLRVRNMVTNPHVVVTTDDTVEVVSIEGTATKHEPRPSIAEAFGVKYDDENTSAEDLTGFLMQQAMYEITPVKAFGLIETPEDFGPRATRWVWP